MTGGEWGGGEGARGSADVDTGRQADGAAPQAAPGQPAWKAVRKEAKEPLSLFLSPVLSGLEEIKPCLHFPLRLPD